MGNLIITAEGLEIRDIPKERRGDSVRKFVEFVCDIDDMNEDYVRISGDVANHQFSYGNIYSNLFYANPQDLKELGIDGRVYQLMSQNIWRPSFCTYKADKEWEKVEQPKGYTGFEGSAISLSPYFYVIHPDWLKYKADYYSQHHDEIPWDDMHKEYLSNPHYLLCKLEDKIKEIGLGEEYKTRYKSHGLDKLTADSLPSRLKIAADMIHEFARDLGGNIHAFAEEIGRLYAEANYFEHEADLSSSERVANGDSLRSIYSLYGQDKNVLYISVDFKHCMLEHHNEVGDHNGEYRLDGTSNKQDNGDAKHSFSRSSARIINDIRKKYHGKYYKNDN